MKYGSNCGNLSAAVGLYAIEEGWVDRRAGRVRMFNPDSGGVVEARMLAGPRQGADGAPARAGSGPWTGSRMELAFVDPGGTLGRGLLPTGRASESYTVDGCEVAVSVVDAGAVYAFVDARAAGVDRPADPLCGPALDRALRVAAGVRRQVAVRIGAAPSEALADAISPNVPKVAFVAPADDPVGSAESPTPDCVARIVSSQSLHGAYAVTGAIATAAAALIVGSVVASVVPPVAETPYTLRIGHASGVLEIRIDWRRNASGVVIERAYTIRTARRLMTGVAHPPPAAHGPVIHAPPARASTSSSSRAPRRIRRAARARRSARG